MNDHEHQWQPVTEADGRVIVVLSNPVKYPYLCSVDGCDTGVVWRVQVPLTDDEPTRITFDDGPLDTETRRALVREYIDHERDTENNTRRDAATTPRDVTTT